MHSLTLCTHLHSLSLTHTHTHLQPFPHRQFTAEEMTHSLLSLGLCPSASLIVQKQSSSTPTQSTGQPGSAPGQTGSAAGQTGSELTGQSSNGASRAAADEMEISGGGVKDKPEDVDMEDESHSHSDDEEMEPELDDNPPPPIPPFRFPRPNIGPPGFGAPGGGPLHQGPPRFGPPGLGPPVGAPLQRGPPGLGLAGGPLHQGPPRAAGFPHLGVRGAFGGEGHKLGGKEAVVIGDAQLLTEEGGV